MPKKFLAGYMVLAIVISIVFYLLSQPRSQSEFTDYVIELIGGNDPDFKIKKEADLEISLILDHITHKITLRSLHNSLEETQPKTHRKQLERFADSCVATVALIRQKGDDTPKKGSMIFEDVVSNLKDHWPKDEIIAFNGKCIIKNPGKRDGSANYKTIAEIGRSGRMRTEFSPYVQPVGRYNSGQTQTDFVVTFDGETWIRAEECHGWIGENTPPKNEARIGPDRQLSDFYHENGLSAFLSYWRLFGQISFENVINGSVPIADYPVNIKVDQLAGNRVQVVFFTGVVGHGFARDVLVFDPTQNWAFISGDQEMGVGKKGKGLTFYVHCSNFKPIGDRNSVYLPKNIVTGFPGDLESTHELTSFAIISEASERTFTLTLGDEWKINYD